MYTSDFTSLDWGMMLDVILDCNKGSISHTEKELEVIFEDLPKNLQYMAFNWGMSDIVFRANLHEWYSENRVK